MTRAGVDVGARQGWSAEDAERWLLSLELFGMRFGLDRMRRLMTALGAPNEAFRAIHVVGTNGKSSTVRMIAALLHHHGVRSGAYLSPHLVSFAERIRVDGADVTPAEFAAAVGRARRATTLVDRTLQADDRVTQFEALTAAAYAHLAGAGVEVAVVEAGLGGRWDATNVIGAAIAVLTNVGLEHTRWLGPTVTDIAREKLAVVNAAGPPTTLVLGADLHPEAEAEALLVAERQGATVVRAPAAPPAGVDLLARGAFQRRNFAVACAAAEACLGRLDPAAVRAAAASTIVPGRFEVLPAFAGDGAGRGRARRRPQRQRDRRARRVAAGVPRGPAARRGAVGARRQGRRRDARHAAAAVRRRRVHRQRQPARAVAGHARVAGGPGRRRWLGRDRPRRARPAPRGRAGAPARRRRGGRSAPRAAAGAGGVVLATGSIYLIADLVRPAGAGRGSTL